MSMKLDIIPRHNTEAMLKNGVGKQESMLAQAVVEGTKSILLQKLDELEQVELRKEADKLRKVRKNYDEFGDGKMAE
ncbi:MAG: hypothetical protein K940chlam9_00666, partial [Chlamydiae bacterium]|nr:hypothetical protein [Chlamydiota bacterium]